MEATKRFEITSGPTLWHLHLALFDRSRGTHSIPFVLQEGEEQFRLNATVWLAATQNGQWEIVGQHLIEYQSRDSVFASVIQDQGSGHLWYRARCDCETGKGHLCFAASYEEARSLLDTA